jgi:hypothetical protein
MRRSGSIYKSIRAIDSSGIETKFKEDCGRITVLSEVSVAPAKSGSDKGKYSYLGFFEKPNIRGGSFIPPPGQYTRSRYRPFVKVMTSALRDESTIMAGKSARTVLLKSIPRKR